MPEAFDVVVGVGPAVSWYVCMCRLSMCAVRAFFAFACAPDNRNFEKTVKGVIVVSFAN